MKRTQNSQNNFGKRNNWRAYMAYSRTYYKDSTIKQAWY